MLHRRAIWLLFAAGCFHHHRPQDVSVSLASAAPASGAVDVVLTDPSRKLTVAIDGALVIDRAYTRRARVEGVPAGPAHLQVAIGGRCERAGVVAADVVVPAGGTATVLLPGPDRDRVCVVATTAAHVALAALLIRPAIHLVHAIVR